MAIWLLATRHQHDIRVSMMVHPIAIVFVSLCTPQIAVSLISPHQETTMASKGSSSSFSHDKTLLQHQHEPSAHLPSPPKSSAAAIDRRSALITIPSLLFATSFPACCNSPANAHDIDDIDKWDLLMTSGVVIYPHSSQSKRRRRQRERKRRLPPPEK